MAVVVLDASVVMGALDAGDAHHASGLSALRALLGSSFHIPASAYAELLVHPTRHGQSAIDRADAFLTSMSIDVAPISREIARRAAAIRATRRSVRLGDALVLATGDVLDADVVLTADARWRELSDRVRTI
jgi:PIN domain nuclease of toxin-antitoxin system